MEALAFLNKWLHLLSIIGMLGGVIFAWLLPPEDEETWHRWLKLEVAFWVVILITGFANFAILSSTVNGTYQMYFGMKAMLAILMAVITFGMAVNHRAFGRRVMLTKLLLVLGIVVVGFSAFLNIGRGNRTLSAPPAPAPPVSPAPTSTVNT